MQRILHIANSKTRQNYTEHISYVQYTLSKLHFLLSSVLYYDLLRLCLVPHEIQNAKCQLFWNNEMQNVKIFMDVFSSIQNAKFFMRWVRAFWLFFFASLGQNPKWRMIHFYQKFCMVLSSILQNNRPKLKIFWVKWGTKYTLNILC
jgi:hypothetical protein